MADANDIKSRTFLLPQKQNENIAIANIINMLAEKIYDPQERF